MAGYTQTNRILRFTSPIGTNKLLPTSFRGSEAISELFEYEIELFAEPNTVITPSAIVGKRVTLELQVNETGSKRYFNGIAACIEGSGGDSVFHSFRLRMVPALWLLSLNRQTRVFQDLSVPDMLRKVLAPYSIAPHSDLQDTYPTLEYCTQYRETDLDFFLRITEQHGIFFYFTHTATDHVLVFADKSSLCAECEVASEFNFALDKERQLSSYKPLIFGFSSRSTLIPGEHTSWDYRFMRYDLSRASPETARSGVEMGHNSHEVYDFADASSAFFKTEGADANTSLQQTKLQTVARQAADAQAVVCQGQGTASTMQAGFSFQLRKYPQAEKNIRYLLTRVTHSVQQQPGYRSEVNEQAPEPYQNTFEARPFTQVYRKVRTMAKPRVSGVVTGKVVTSPGDDSHLDRFGRVCVQFWWDRHRPPQTPDKTLLRVSQQWAGKEWGTYFWPRVGDEVLIDFIEGDPDAPIVVGSLYNGANMPKYDPKAQYTRSGILTRSSKRGDAANANELRFDDLKDSEQIFLNAERDFDLHVEHDWHTLVDNEEHREITRNQYHQVGGRAELSVAEGQSIWVAGDRQISVQGTQSEIVSATSSLQVGEFQVSNTGIAHTIQAEGAVKVHGVGTVILQTEGVLYLMVEGVSLAVTAAGLAILAALDVGEIAPPPIIVPTPPPPAPSPTSPTWPGDDPRRKNDAI